MRTSTNVIKIRPRRLPTKKAPRRRLRPREGRPRRRSSPWTPRWWRAGCSSPALPPRRAAISRRRGERSRATILVTQRSNVARSSAPGTAKPSSNTQVGVDDTPAVRLVHRASTAPVARPGVHRVAHLGRLAPPPADQAVDHVGVVDREAGRRSGRRTGRHAGRRTHRPVVQRAPTRPSRAPAARVRHARRRPEGQADRLALGRDASERRVPAGRRVGSVGRRRGSPDGARRGGAPR